MKNIPPADLQRLPKDVICAIIDEITHCASRIQSEKGISFATNVLKRSLFVVIYLKLIES